MQGSYRSREPESCRGGVEPCYRPTMRDPLSQDRREVIAQEEGIVGVKEPQLPLVYLLCGRLRGLLG